MGVTLVMLEAIRDHFRATGKRIGMKPAGGIRTTPMAIECSAIWLPKSFFAAPIRETGRADWKAILPPTPDQDQDVVDRDAVVEFERSRLRPAGRVLVRRRLRNGGPLQR